MGWTGGLGTEDYLGHNAESWSDLNSPRRTSCPQTFPALSPDRLYVIPPPQIVIKGMEAEMDGLRGSIMDEVDKRETLYQQYLELQVREWDRDRGHG